MSRGVCLILNITYEEKQGDGWRHVTEVKLKLSKWITWYGKTPRCSSSRVFFLGMLDVNIYWPPPTPQPPEFVWANS